MSFLVDEGFARLFIKGCVYLDEVCSVRACTPDVSMRAVRGQTIRMPGLSIHPPSLPSSVPPSSPLILPSFLPPSLLSPSLLSPSLLSPSLPHFSPVSPSTLCLSSPLSQSCLPISSSSHSFPTSDLPPPPSFHPPSLPAS